MTVRSFEVGKDGRQITKPFIRVDSPVLPGTKYPFVTVSDGKYGVCVEFTSEKELDELKRMVNALQLKPLTDFSSAPKTAKVIKKSKLFLNKV